jgi:hypothetical protein
MEPALLIDAIVRQAAYTFVQERGSLLQTELLTRFRNDDEASVRAVVSELVESGLVFRSGRGESTILRAAQPDEVSLADDRDDENLASRVWLMVHRQRGPDRDRNQASPTAVPARSCPTGLHGMRRRRRAAPLSCGRRWSARARRGAP